MEDLQKDIKNEVLQNMRVFLCKHLEPDRYYPLLRFNRVIDEDDEHEIRHQFTRFSKAELLLDKLERRDDAYDQLVMVLQHDETQHYILQKIEEEFRSLWKKTLERNDSEA